MKKLLAICSIFLTVCATFTGCGSENNSDADHRDSSAVTDDRSDMDRDENSMGDRVNDAVKGAGEAGDDIIEGATNAIGDVIDGLDGDDDHSSDKKSDKTTTGKNKR